MKNMTSRHARRGPVGFLLGLCCVAALAAASPARAGFGQWTTGGPAGGSITVLTASPNIAADGTIFAGAAGGRVYKSTNRGASWTVASNGINSSETVLAIAVSPNYAADGTVFVGLNSYGGLYKTTDRGASWAKLGVNDDIRSIVLSPNYAYDLTVFAGSYGGVYKSTNGGASWATSNSGLPAGTTYWCQLGISPNFATDKTIYVGNLMSGGVYKSVNAGQSWSAYNTGLTVGSINAVAVVPGGAAYLAAVGGVYKYSASGWTRISATMTSVASLAVSPSFAADGTIFAATSNNGVYRTTDGGATWTQVNSGIPYLAVLSVAVSPSYATDQTVLAGTSFAGIVVSANRGSSWTTANQGIISQGLTALGVSPNIAADGALFAAGGYGIYKSVDRGATWSIANAGLPGNSVNALAISPAYAQDHTVFASNSSNVYKTTDSGASWNTVNNGVAGAWIDALAVSPNYAVDQTVFAAAYSSGKGVYKSTSGGASWSQVLALASQSIYCIAISPNYAADQTVLIGTSTAGVYRTTNGGAGWTQVNTGLPASNLTMSSLAFSPNYASDGTVYAGTTGQSLYKSTNGGASWTPANAGIPYQTIHSIAISPAYATDSTLLIGTGAGGYHGGTTSTGVLKSTNGGASWTAMNAGFPAYLGGLAPAVVYSSAYATDGMAFAATSWYGVYGYAFPNAVPLAVNDSYNVREAGTLSVPAPGTLTNDSDPGARPLTAVLVAGPAHGALTLNADGSFAYTPDASYTGTDSFSYKANNGLVDSNVATVTITVVPKETPVVTWATPVDIVYGTALGTAQLDAVASVPGTFTYTPPAGTVLNAGTAQTLSVSFTPADTANYRGVTASTAINVTKATPAVTWASPVTLAYGRVLSSTQLNATASVPGTFVYTPAAGTTFPLGSFVLGVLFTPADATNYGSASATATLNVVKATPVITWSDPPDCGYPSVLDGWALRATASVPGTLTYTPPAGTILNAGVHTLSVSFTPTDTVHYTDASASVTLNVHKGTPVINWDYPGHIDYGTPLGSAQLNASTSVPGTFVYTPPGGTVLNAGWNQTLSVTFTPDDPANYESATRSTTIQVLKGVPVLSWTRPADIVYGTPLGAAQLNATSTVPGTFVYTPAPGTVLNAGGDQWLSVSFTPTDSANYISGDWGTQITVRKATPAITWTTPADIAYGTRLSAAQLNATASVSGTLVYSLLGGPQVGPGTLLRAGTQTLVATLYPTDGTNYEIGGTTTTINVLKATPVVTWANPADIVYGMQLGTAQLNATASVPGTFTYTPPAGTVLNAGAAQTLSVRFAPSDTGDFNEVTATATINVQKLTASVSWSSPGAIVYGTALGAAQLNATASVPGTFTYNPTAGTLLSAGAAQPLSVTFSPADATNYNGETAGTTINVQKATPVVTWGKPADIIYGTALGAAQLNATSSVPGAFTYAPAAGTVLNAGSGQTLTVTFTPVDSANYNSSSASAAINVAKATPAITWGNPADIIYGTALNATQLNATTSVPGTLVYTPPAGMVLNPGSGQVLAATFAPADAANYNGVVAHAVINVIYDFGAGFLPPLDRDTPFKLGSTIPVKFSLVNAFGAPVSTARVLLRLQHFSSSQPDGDAIDATPTGGADTGNVFLGDGAGHYHFNLSTKDLSVGSWSLQAVMDDGTVRSIVITIKEK
jgi:hypothetical protein